MSRKIVHSDEEVVKLVELLSQIDEVAMNPEFKIEPELAKLIDDTMIGHIDGVFDSLTELMGDRKQISALTPKAIEKITPVQWYAFVFHAVSLELQKSPGELSWFLVSAINTFAEEYPEKTEDVLNTPLSRSDMADIVYSTEYDTFAVLQAMDFFLKQIKAKEEEEMAKQ